jgi:hypothetical protein
VTIEFVAYLHGVSTGVGAHDSPSPPRLKRKVYC